MKILMPLSYFQPEQMSSSHLNDDLFDAFSKSGAEAYVVCPIPTRGISKEVAERYKHIKNEKLYDGFVSVRRFWAPQEGKNSLLRAFRYLWCNLRQYQLVKQQEEADVLLVASTPPTQGCMGVKIKKSLQRKLRKPVPMVFNLQDVFPDSLVSAGMTRKGSLLWKIGRKLEDYTYRNADKIIVISEDFKKNIMAKGVPESKIVVIPNWADTANIHPVGRGDNLLVSRYNLDPGKFYVTYCGNVGLGQNWDLLLAVAKRIAKKNPDICFVIVGDGAAKENVESRVRNEGIGNVVLLPFQPYEDIAHVFSLGDVGLIISKGGVRDSSVPSKTWNIMAAEKPIISSFDEDSELSRIVRESGCGIAVPADDEDRLEEAVLKAYGEMDLAEAGRLGKAYLDQHLSKDVCVNAYVDVIEAAVAEARRG